MLMTLPTSHLHTRKFGVNFIEPKKPTTYWELVVEGFQDATVIMLCVAAVISLGFGWYDDPAHGWIEGAAICISVIIVTNVAAGTNYAKEKQFRAVSYGACWAAPPGVWGARGGGRSSMPST